MTLREQMMDKYWVDFLKYCDGDFSTEAAKDSDFWHWFYNTLCEGTGRIAQEEWSKL